MSGGGQNSTVSNTAPPQQFTNAYSTLLDRGTQVANQPLQQYGGDRVAQFTPDQNAAFGSISAEQGTAQPYIDKAQTHFDAATAPLWGGLPQFSQSGIAGYMPTGVDSYSDLGKYQSPYTQNVVDATQAQFDNQNRQNQLTLAGNEVSKGAWGGDRAGVAAANLQGQEDLAQAPVIAGLRDAGFRNAQQALYQQQGLGLQKYQVGQNEFNQQQQAHLGADEANAWLNSQAGFGTAALGTQSQNSRLTDASTLLQSGGLQQTQNQENLNQPYYDFLQQQAYPFQTTNFLSGLASGLGSAAGGTGTSTSTSDPSLLSTAVGLGTTGLALNKLGAFDNIGGWFGNSGAGSDFLNAGGDGYFGGAARGGRIPHRARGGIAAAVNDNEFPEPQRMTGTGGLHAYADGSDVADDGQGLDYAMFDAHPMARPSMPGDTPAGIAAVAPPAPSGVAAAAPSNRYASDYTPPMGTDRLASAAKIRKDAGPMALLTAGLGILGSGNVGKGALEGVKYYQGQQKDAEGIDEKAAEAADTGNYRSADLKLQGQRFSDAADEAAARLKQQDNQFQQTNTRETQHDKDTAAYQKGELNLSAARLAEERRNHNLVMGLDDTGKPADLDRAVDGNSKSILAQTGLSLPAFMALTGQASKLPRDKASRMKAFNEAEAFANKNGVDTSTFSTQYDAYNDTLKQNIVRNNATKIMEGELQGTISNLKPVADAAGAGHLRLANVGKLFAGQEVNDPVVNQYAFNLQQLRTELAAYSAATQGRGGSGITQQDYQEAERVIKNGLSSKGADGLLKGVENATNKMNGVLQNSVRSSNRAVWDLFGVGDHYDKLHPVPGAAAAPGASGNNGQPGFQGWTATPVTP